MLRGWVEVEVVVLEAWYEKDKQVGENYVKEGLSSCKDTHF